MSQDKITIDEVTYIAVDGKNCQDCDLNKQRCTAKMQCNPSERTDNRNVVFKILENESTI
jgi:hypothetical protein